MRLSLARIAAATAGTVLGDPTTTVSGFANDSRTVERGQCFVAIVDARDGHDFVADAIARGGAAALVARLPPGTSGANLVVVADPVLALGQLAGSVRHSELRDARVIGITGSTGKTSTKDFLASVSRRVRRTTANEASFNNEIGMPLTLLGAPAETEVVICEMGARFAGNIAELCAIALPDVGVITNIGEAHAESLGWPDESGRPRGAEQVKGELLEALPPDGLAVLNADDPTSDRLRRRAGTARVLLAGAASSADVRIERLALRPDLRAEVTIATPWGMIETTLGLRGAHQSANAALAAAAALHEGISLEAVAIGLAEARGSSWRMDLSNTVAGIYVLNDAYNANPHSMHAALRALGDVAVTGRRTAVLGEMRELGERSVAAHSEVGRSCADLGVDELIAVGTGRDIEALADAAAASGVAVVRRVDDATQVRRCLHLSRGDAILVKASRAVGLERVALDLIDELGPAPEVRA